MAESYRDPLLTFMKKGEIILHPTDTIWSLCWSFENKEALDKILSVKSPSQEDPIVLLASDIDMVKKHAERIHPRVETLIGLHSRPLSIIYPGLTRLPEHFNEFKDRIAMRIVRHLQLHQLVCMLEDPIATISTRLSGKDFPIDFLDIDPKILSLADRRIGESDAQADKRAPSVVASYDENGELLFIRD
ncbi:MAG: Sua5/YciO/YrdC/YwlC family protein [Saprospiraceae bacterium]|nr:Sua5/YciO/YrdC/YwlC family protein [Saprospiraceae bacterium]